MLQKFCTPVLHSRKTPLGLLQAKITHLKSAGMLIFKYCAKRYGLGLSNELLFIIIAQGAAKLWPINVGG